MVRNRTESAVYVAGARGVSKDIRHPDLPDVPKFFGGGTLLLMIVVWIGIDRPACLSRSLVERISRDVAQIQERKEVKERMDTWGASVFTNTPDQFGALRKGESARYAKVIEAANIWAD
jgi:tripartite-type tricarboxylate transporter receptor subunit TctC